MTVPTVPIQLSQLAVRLGARLLGDPALEIRGVNTIQDAGPEEICFLSSPKQADRLKTSRAAGVLVQQPLDDYPRAQLVVGNVNKALIAALTIFAPKLTAQTGIHRSATVEPDARIDPEATVGPGAYIGHHVKIGSRTVIGPNCTVGENTEIGADCRLDANVAVYHNCKIGNRCIIQANATVGSTGFGYSFIDGRHQFIPHNGGVILEDGVEIGANTSIDRAKFGNTLIGAGTKIDNLVQIAHNVIIGKACLLASQVGIAGSTRLGDGVVVAGQAGISDNLVLASGCIVGGGAAVTTDIGPGKKVWGSPAIDLQNQLRSVSLFQRLPETAKELKDLTRRIKQLEAAKND